MEQESGIAKYFTDADLSAFHLRKFEFDHHKFYLPDCQTMASNILADEIRSIVRLPFERIAILHPTESIPLEDNEFILTISREEKISFFVDFVRRKGGEMRTQVENNLGSLDEIEKKVGQFIFVSSLKVRSQFGKIITNSVPAHLAIFIEQTDIKFVYVGNMQDDNFNFYKGILNESKNAVFSLCLMLSLKNVHSEEIIPSEKLNKKRTKCNRIPLFNYHILVVDGERWERPISNSQDGSGIRSHYRRGHIRRLNNPDRKIFVRSCIVIGSRPGFIEKDYAVIKK